MTRFFILLCVLSQVACIIQNIFKPVFQFHDRREYLSVKCDGSSVTNNVSMFFIYNDKQHQVPAIENRLGVYTGNFSVVSKEQSRVMIICQDLNTKKILGSRIYFFGYPPSYIIEHYQVDLNCRDFNLKRMVCCLTPNVSAMEQLLGFEENKSGQFEANLYFYDFEHNELAINRSCYELTKQTLSPTSTLHIRIQNILGKEIFNFTINRLAIQKPNTPKYFQKEINSTCFNFYVDLLDFGEYEVNVSCSSLSPIVTHKVLTFVVDDHMSETISFCGWKHNSKLSCTFNAKVRFGNSTYGNSSEPLIVALTLLEEKPNRGPDLSPLFVYYNASENNIISGVVVYFINVDLVDRNGIITKYRWKCDSCFSEKRNASNIIHDVSFTSRSLSLDNATLGSGLWMTACTKVGCSDSWSSFLFMELKDCPTNSHLSIIKNLDDSSNLTLIWQPMKTLNNSLFLLVCTRSLSDSHCLSINQINLTTYIDNYTYYRVGESKMYAFALVLLEEDSFYKLRWQTCVYNSFPDYEIRRRLQNFDISQYVNRSKPCGSINCKVIMDITIPRCDIFNDVYVKDLILEYESTHGKMVKTIPVMFEQKIRFILEDLKIDRNSYMANISIATMYNNTFLWYSIPITTHNESSLNIYVAIGISLFILFIVAMVLIFICIRKLRNKSGKNNKVFSKTTMLKNNVPVAPLNILNAEKRDFYKDCLPPFNDEKKLTSSQEGLLERDYKSDVFHSSSDKHSTASTSFDTPETSKSDKSLSSSDLLVNTMDNDPKAYCGRPSPDIKYSHIAAPLEANKKISKAFSECANSISV